MKWISLKDRFPEAGVWVIAATHTYIPFGSSRKVRLATEIYYDGENEHGHHWLKDGDWENEVTHWMSKPEPPEAEVIQ